MEASPVNWWLNNERCQESRLRQASVQCCQATIASNSLWQNVKNNNKQTKNLNNRKWIVKKNQNQDLWKAKLEDPHTDHMWTVWQQLCNTEEVKFVMMVWKIHTSLSHAAQIESAQLWDVAEIHIVQTDILFFSYLIFHFLYSLTNFLSQFIKHDERITSNVPTCLR